VTTFAEALTASDPKRPPHLLLGNGFSRALRDDIFAYDALFDRADFAGLSPEARQSFDVLRTRDFESVMRTLRSAAALLSIYEPGNPGRAQRLRADADALRDLLVRTIASNHPDRPGEIALEAYAACRAFLANFDHIYTLNYDLLLYWALMQQELEPKVAFDDGFRTPDEGPEDYVTWDVEKTDQQNVFYLHGALHIFDAGAEIQKYTWINTGVPLIDQIREALERNFYPLFVAEGESDGKLARIRHSDFLARAYRSFAKIGGSLFIYGHSMAPNDEHIVRLIGKSRIRQLFIGLYGDPESPDNRRIRTRAGALAASRARSRPLEVVFFDAGSVRVWG